MLARRDLLEFQYVIVVVGPNHDQILQQIAAMLLHQKYESLVKIAFNVENKSAPFGVRLLGVFVFVEGGDGVEDRINDRRRFAGADCAEGNNVCEESLFVEGHSAEVDLQFLNPLPGLGDGPVVFDRQLGGDQAAQANREQPQGGLRDNETPRHPQGGRLQQAGQDPNNRRAQRQQRDCLRRVGPVPALGNLARQCACDFRQHPPLYCCRIRFAPIDLICFFSAGALTVEQVRRTAARAGQQLSHTLRSSRPSLICRSKAWRPFLT